MTAPPQEPTTALAVRDRAPVSIQTPAARLQIHRRRLRDSLRAVQRHAVALTPAHQLRASPITWAVVGATLGVLLGVITAPRRCPPNP